MKKFIIAWCINFAFIVLLVNIIEFAYHGGFVPKKTEVKYLRNINKYELTHKNYFWTLEYGGQDTLKGYITDNSFYQINILSKWHFKDIGLIRRGGKLHKKLDSLASLWVDKENKYK